MIRYKVKITNSTYQMFDAVEKRDFSLFLIVECWLTTQGAQQAPYSISDRQHM
jgi:hypothetical protein